MSINIAVFRGRGLDIVKLPPNLHPSKNLSYILGVLLGRIGNTDITLLRLIKILIEEAGYRSTIYGPFENACGSSMYYLSILGGKKETIRFHEFIGSEVK